MFVYFLFCGVSNLMLVALPFPMDAFHVTLLLSKGLIIFLQDWCRRRHEASGCVENLPNACRQCMCQAQELWGWARSTGSCWMFWVFAESGSKCLHSQFVQLCASDLLFLLFVFNWSRCAGHIVWGSWTPGSLYPKALSQRDIPGNRNGACHFTLRMNPKGEPNKISIIRRHSYLVACEMYG